MCSTALLDVPNFDARTHSARLIGDDRFVADELVPQPPTNTALAVKMIASGRHESAVFPSGMADLRLDAAGAGT